MSNELDQTFLYYPAELSGFDDIALKTELYRREKCRIKSMCPFCGKSKFSIPCVNASEHRNPVTGEVDSYKYLEDSGHE